MTDKDPRFKTVVCPKCGDTATILPSATAWCGGDKGKRTCRGTEMRPKTQEKRERP